MAIGIISGTGNIIDTHDHKIKDEHLASLDNPAFGYNIFVPVTTKEESSIIVRTIISGPFTFPKGYTLVSAIYDVTQEKKLKEPVTIELQHCVSVDNELLQEKMHFARATINFETKRLDFEVIEGGLFHIGDSKGSITPKKDCLNNILCILFKGAL